MQVLHLIWAASIGGITLALHVSDRGSSPRRSTTICLVHIMAIMIGCLPVQRGSIPLRGATI